jgi:protochlorophyllide reductase
LDFSASGVHWSWGNRQKKDQLQFEQELSNKVTDSATAERVWQLSSALVGLD